MLLGTPLLVALGFLGTIAYVYARTPIPSPPVLSQTTFLYDRHGQLITTLHASVNRIDIPFSQMPASLRDAVIASEDRNYYHEGGVSLIGILRAAWVDLTGGQLAQGGSTITQQYVKNVYTGDQRTFVRKIREAIIAEKLSHAYTKDEILAKYLNTVYFGQGAYGVQAAAETYWGIPARKLTPAESATLAGILPAPSDWNPAVNPKMATELRNTVLGEMGQQGYLTRAEAIRWQASPMKVVSSSAPVSRAAYFVQYVTQQLVQRFGDQQVYSGGLRVTTTLDASMQRAAEQAVAAHLTHPGDPSAALVAIDPTTGAVRAMVGGKNFTQAQFNLATQGMRPAGSSFKAFTLAAAMEQRVSLRSYWNGPPGLLINNSVCGTWDVHNYGDESAGKMDLLNATANSVNTIFAQLVSDVGPANVVAVAHRMGITTPLYPYCSITLGSQPVSPLEMADGYATLADQGVHHAPTGVWRVQTSSGQTLSAPQAAGTQAISANDANLVTYALEGVIQHGTGVAANIGRPAAGKTGTGENYTDAWFCGYTPQLATCVWVGYPKGEIPMLNVEGWPTVVGGSIPAEIWHDFMLRALASQPVEPFTAPSFAGYTYQPPGAVPSPTPRPSPSPTPSAGPTPTPSPTLPPSPTSSPIPTSSPSGAAAAEPRAAPVPRPG